MRLHLVKWEKEIREKNILEGITFKEKNEYHYKVDDKFVYYLKEDLEKNPPLVQDGIEKKNRGKVKRVSENLPVGAISKYGEENMENTNIIPEEWDDALRSLQPTYLNYIEKSKK